MSAITDIKERLDSYLKIIKEKILGVNNERLEFVMDSFYKLDPGYRNGLLAIIVGFISTFILAAVFIYFYQVKALKDELNLTFNALNELKSLSYEDAREGARFDKLIDKVKSRTRSITFKPFFERLSRQSKIPLKSISDRQPEMDPQNPLSARMQEVHVDLKLAKVSIPRLLNFLVDIEKANHYLRVQNLKITGIYGNKLYFDVDVLVRGYKVTR
ncbi:MAG: hypothetical protein AB8G05_02750 [Oligoflexales bacterium]